MAQIGNGQLADRIGIFGKGDFAVENPGGAVSSQNVFEFNAPPGRHRLALNLLEEFAGAAPEGDESNPHLVEQIKIGIGGEFGIKYKFFGKRACGFSQNDTNWRIASACSLLRNCALA